LEEARVLARNLAYHRRFPEVQLVGIPPWGSSQEPSREERCPGQTK
jgi:hypothetical protein